MPPVTTITGAMVPLDRADVDTDQIMPKQFLKRTERTGFGEFVFHDWRDDPDFVLNDERYAGANVLVTGPNFGSGSSREHAPWGLQQYGFEAVIAPSFADIFRNNCAKIGLLTITLPAARCRELIALASERPAAGIRIDLPEQTVVTELGVDHFEIDPHTKHLLVEGLDTIDLTLARAGDIAAYEERRPAFMPVAS
ncbi:MAG: 3-isopropylmalate dehydratase small subunit [Actinobacteria bacterium]|nr:3-isopropylmalate dehydratase small subunit [Actinomycetota bacterium]